MIKMKPETIARRKRERAIERTEQRTSLIDRLRANYCSDAAAVSVDYAEAVWGSMLRDMGESA
jgi:hypothetical protein